MSPSQFTLEAIFAQQIQTLALRLRPSTLNGYRGAARRFLAYLRAAFPEINYLSELRRDPHLLGWFGSLCESQPPLSPKTRWSLLLLLRRLFDELAANGHCVVPQLIRPQDFPPLPVYLPRPLSLPDDQRLQHRLRCADDWLARALLLVRLTGMRIGECLDLRLDCLRQIGPDTWGVHIPLGKLHTERMFPADDQIRQTVARILALRILDPASDATASQGFLLPRVGSRSGLYNRLRSTLTKAAQQAGCSGPVTPHPLRHSFASEMVRLGVSLPVVMQLLGHKDIRMTLRYVQVTQEDLQREFYAARHKAVEAHRIPALSLPAASTPSGPDGIRQALSVTRHLMEMYRRQIADQKISRKLRRLDRRLLAVATELEKLAKDEK
jgi:site-specific recombinase XerD